MLRHAKCNCVKWRKVLSLLGFGYLEMITLLGVYYYIIYRVKVCDVLETLVVIGFAVLSDDRWHAFRF